MPKKLKNTDTTANLGSEAELWATSAALSNNMKVTEYKHVVFSPILLKCCAASCERDAAV